MAVKEFLLDINQLATYPLIKIIDKVIILINNIIFTNIKLLYSALIQLLTSSVIGVNKFFHVVLKKKRTNLLLITIGYTITRNI